MVWRVASVLFVVAIAQGALLGQVEYRPIEFSSRANVTLDYLLARVGGGPGPRGPVELGGVPFSIPNGQNVWFSLDQVEPNPRVLEIPVRIRGVSEVHTIINSDWGRRGPGSYAHLEFVGSEGAVYRKDLVGGVDVRDFFNGQHANTINGTSTVEVWSNGPNVRLDKQRVELPSEFRGQELSAIRVVDEGEDWDTESEVLLWQRIWIAGLTVGVISTPVFSVEFAQSGPRCMSILVTSDLAFRGGELGIAMDPEAVLRARIEPGEDLPEGSQIQFVPEARAECEDPTIERGVTMGWIHPLDSPLVGAGRREVLRICFEFSDLLPPDVCTPLRFVSCLGNPAAPVRNVITGADGASLHLAMRDGEVCRLPEIPFQRGDANADASFDISDPILILGCLFLDTRCPRCDDLMDANDDGRVDISDPVHLLDWRFRGGDGPPPPRVDCGLDPTADDLRDCEGETSCTP